MRRVVLALTVALAACSSAPADCPPSTRLVGDTCLVTCSAASECLSTEACVDGLCTRGAAPHDDAGPPVGCTRNRDCGEQPRIDDSAACEFAEDCANDGTHLVLTFKPECQAGVCGESALESKREACQRDTEGETCNGPSAESPWSPCGYHDACVLTGTRNRMITKSTCQSSACITLTNVEVDMTMCTRQVENGTRCAAGICCSGSCVSPSDRTSCGVCGVDCGNRRCLTLGNERFACGCEGSSECSGFGYGPDTTCGGLAGTNSICQCGCPDSSAGCSSCPGSTAY